MADVLKFTYGRDPSRSSRDAVRFYTGDVERAHAKLDDREIDFAITQNPNLRIAAAVCLDQLAARYSQKADITVGDVSKSLGDVADKLRKRAEELRTEAANRGGLPFFGGLTHAGKDELDARTTDVQPHFRIGQFDSAAALQFDEGSVDDPSKP